MADERVVIAGAGPAGLAAACELSLYGYRPLVFERNVPGGLLLNAGSVKNYPGVPRGISGRDLAKLFPLPERLQKISVTSIRRQETGDYLVEWDGGVLSSDAVITATGTIPVKAFIPGVDPVRIFYETAGVQLGGYSSAAVLGGGDAALDYAVTLAERMNVNVYARSGFSGAVVHLLKQAENNSSIRLFPDHSVFSDFSEDIVLVAFGRRKNLSCICSNLLQRPPEDGSFHVCGDCANGICRQAVIAAGDGVRAAMRTASYLGGKAR